MSKHDMMHKAATWGSRSGLVVLEECGGGVILWRLL